MVKQNIEVHRYKEDAVPYKVTFSFTNNNAEIIFDDTEILKVFDDFKKQYPDSPIDIIVNLNGASDLIPKN